MQDHLKDLISICEADGTLAGLVAARIYGAELPRSEVDSQPRQSLVLKYSGSPGGPGSADYTRLVEFRVDSLSYGATPEEADAVRRALYDVMKDLNRQQQTTTLFHRVVHVSGPIQARDRDTDWPFVLDSYEILAAQDAVI